MRPGRGRARSGGPVRHRAVASRRGVRLVPRSTKERAAGCSWNTPARTRGLYLNRVSPSREPSLGRLELRLTADVRRVMSTVGRIRPRDERVGAELWEDWFWFDWRQQEHYCHSPADRTGSGGLHEGTNHGPVVFPQG